MLFSHLAKMYESADARRILTAVLWVIGKGQQDSHVIYTLNLTPPGWSPWKSKVDNLYSGSKRPDQVRSIRCRTASTILPLFIGLHAMAATNGASTWKPSQGTNLYCLVNRGILVWTTCPRSLPDNDAAGNRTHDLPIASPRPYHYTTKPPVKNTMKNNLSFHNLSVEDAT